MKALSIHPIRYLRAHHPLEYLSVHLDYKEIWKRLLTSLRLPLKKIFESAEQVVAVMVLFVALVFFFMQLIEGYVVTACFYDAITSMVFPPIEFRLVPN